MNQNQDINRNNSRRTAFAAHMERQNHDLVKAVKDLNFHILSAINNIEHNISLLQLAELGHKETECVTQINNANKSLQEKVNIILSEIIPSKDVLETQISPKLDEHGYRRLFDGKLALVVDDNNTTQKISRALLQNVSFNVDVADDGADALRLISKNNYDIVLMDCEMPEINGYEATMEIRLREKNVDSSNRHKNIIIAITANAMQGDRQKCLTAGMDDYVSKPVNKELLYHKVAYWLHKKSKIKTLPK